MHIIVITWIAEQLMCHKVKLSKSSKDILWVGNKLLVSSD